MKLRQLEYLEAVAQYGSISKAAQNLFVAQSSVSKALQDLESELESALFYRSVAGVELTEQGRSVLERAEKILLLRDEIAKIGKKEMQPLQGFFRIGGSSGFLLRLLNDLTIYCYAKYPKLKLQPEMYFNDQKLINDVRSKKLQAGILLIYAFEEDSVKEKIRAQNLEVYNMMADRSIFVVRPDHPLAKRKRVRVSELMGYPFVSMRPKSDYEHGPVFSLLRRYGYHGRTVYMSNTEELDRFVLNSESNAFTSLCQAHFYLRKNDGIERFSKVRVIDEEQDFTVCWIQPKGKSGKNTEAIRMRLAQQCQELMSGIRERPSQ